VADSRLYTDLADWWPLLSPPDDYAEEAGIYRRLLFAEGEPTPSTLLELGSGGGHNAFHLKPYFDEVVLVDIAAGMLAQSRRLNSGCTHIEGDMRAVRLGRRFDRVFVHDAICYMTTESDLRAALETAYVHCRPGGLALFCPDHLLENFRASTEHGGSDGIDRAIRYLEWTWDPDPTDATHLTDYVYVLRHPDGRVTVEHDRHLNGLFARADWLRLLADVGFAPVEVVPFEHSDVAPGTIEHFLARRPLD
jgi:SAM-dependent methyltransferase